MADPAPVQTFMDSETLKKPSVIVGLVFVGMLIVGVIVYLIIKFSSGMKYFSIIKAPMALKGLTAQKEVSKSDLLPTLSNGIEYTYAFWVYLNSVEQTDKPKMLFQRGTDKANPIAYIDSSSNTLTFSLRTAVADGANPQVTVKTNPAFTLNVPVVPPPPPSSGNPTSVEKDLADDKCYYTQAKIDYVPLQQWMHVAIAIQGQYAVIYKDGEIYKVINVASGIQTCPTSSNVPKVVSFASTDGSVFVGPPTTGSAAVNGAISKLLFFNYAISLADAKALYLARPVATGALSALNLPFGVRSPIYSLEEASA
jgi:hypothetical protein